MISRHLDRRDRRSRSACRRTVATLPRLRVMGRHKEGNTAAFRRSTRGNAVNGTAQWVGLSILEADVDRGTGRRRDQLRQAVQRLWSSDVDVRRARRSSHLPGWLRSRDTDDEPHWRSYFRATAEVMDTPPGLFTLAGVEQDDVGVRGRRRQFETLGAIRPPSCPSRTRSSGSQKADAQLWWLTWGLRQHLVSR